MYDFKSHRELFLDALLFAKCKALLTGSIHVVTKKNKFSNK